MASPVPVSSTSMSRACCGQSMCDAVVICQNPALSEPSVIAVILCCGCGR